MSKLILVKVLLKYWVLALDFFLIFLAKFYISFKIRLTCRGTIFVDLGSCSGRSFFFSKVPACFLHLLFEGVGLLSQYLLWNRLSGCIGFWIFQSLALIVLFLLNPIAIKSTLWSYFIQTLLFLLGLIPKEVHLMLKERVFIWVFIIDFWEIIHIIDLAQKDAVALLQLWVLPEWMIFLLSLSHRLSAGLGIQTLVQPLQLVEDAVFVQTIVRVASHHDCSYQI